MFHHEEIRTIQFFIFFYFLFYIILFIMNLYLYQALLDLERYGFVDLL
jgi:hypothetical protein